MIRQPVFFHSKLRFSEGRQDGLLVYPINMCTFAGNSVFTNYI